MIDRARFSPIPSTSRSSASSTLLRLTRSPNCATTFSAVVLTAVMHPVVWFSVGTVYLCWLLLLAAFWGSHRLKHERLTTGETIVLCFPLYVAVGLAVYRYSVGG